MGHIYVLKDACKGITDCGICRYVCPKNVFDTGETANEKGYYPPKLVDEETCSGCENCMIFCPDMAIIVDKGQKKKASR